jgi:hypothetical protein
VESEGGGGGGGGGPAETTTISIHGIRRGRDLVWNLRWPQHDVPTRRTAAVSGRVSEPGRVPRKSSWADPAPCRPRSAPAASA